MKIGIELSVMCLFLFLLCSFSLAGDDAPIVITNIDNYKSDNPKAKVVELKDKPPTEQELKQYQEEQKKALSDFEKNYQEEEMRAEAARREREQKELKEKESAEAKEAKKPNNVIDTGQTTPGEVVTRQPN